MHWGFCSRSIAIGGICLIATVATGALIEPARAQAQQADGFGLGGTANEFYPLWAKPYLFSGFNAGANGAIGSNQTAYTTKIGSGTVGLFLESNRNDGAWSSGSSGNFFGSSFDSSTSLRQDWFALGNSVSRTSMFGSYKSEPNTALFNGLYTTASFGVTSISANPPGLPGLTNFSPGNGVVGMTASAGLGLKLTPQITIEGSVGFTQLSPSGFR
jgi:hypothetical protein